MQATCFIAQKIYWKFTSAYRKMARKTISKEAWGTCPKAVLVQVRFWFMAKHMFGSSFMAKHKSLNAKQCLKKKSKK